MPLHSAAAEPKIERIAVGPAYALGVWRRFTVCVFDGVAGMSGLEEIHEAIRTWRTLHPEQTADLAVVHPTRANMTSAERDKWVQVLKETEHFRVAGATVILATGMLGSLHRGIVTSFNLIVPPPHPVKVFPDVYGALIWLTPHLRDVCGDAPVQALAREIDAMHGGIPAGVER